MTHALSTVEIMFQICSTIDDGSEPSGVNASPGQPGASGVLEHSADSPPLPPDWPPPPLPPPVVTVVPPFPGSVVPGGGQLGQPTGGIQRSPVGSLPVTGLSPA